MVPLGYNEQLNCIKLKLLITWKVAWKISTLILETRSISKLCIDWWNGLQKIESSYRTCGWRSSSNTNFPIINSFSISLDALCMLPYMRMILIQELAVCVVMSLSPAWNKITLVMPIFLSLALISNLHVVYILLLDITDRDIQSWVRKWAFITTHDPRHLTTYPTMRQITRKWKFIVEGLFMGAGFKMTFILCSLHHCGLVWFLSGISSIQQ